MTLELSRVSPYSEICTALAKQLGLEDPDKLRLTTHTAFNATPMAHPLRSGLALTVSYSLQVVPHAGDDFWVLCPLYMTCEDLSCCTWARPAWQLQNAW